MPELLPFVYRKTDGCAVQWLGSSFGVCETCVDVHSPWDFFPIGFLWKCYIYLYMNGWFRLGNGRHINIPDSSHGSFGIWPQETSVLAMGKENSRDTACVSWIFFVPRTVQWLYKANPPKKNKCSWLPISWELLKHVETVDFGSFLPFWFITMKSPALSYKFFESITIEVNLRGLNP